MWFPRKKKTKKNKYRQLDDEFYSLGTELEIDDEELDDMEKKYTDPHKRLLKMFGVWLEEGENPTYWKLLKALANIGQKMWQNQYAP